MLDDEAGPTALQVAVAAGVLLAVVVGADVALNRTVSLEVETGEGWRTVAQIPVDRSSFDDRGTLVEVNRSEDVRFRVVADNQRLDAYEADYEVSQHGERIAQGQVSADRLGVGADAFTVAADTLLPEAEDEDRPPRVGVDLELAVDGERAHAWLDVREVPG